MNKIFMLVALLVLVPVSSAMCHQNPDTVLKMADELRKQSVISNPNAIVPIYKNPIPMPDVIPKPKIKSDIPVVFQIMLELNEQFDYDMRHDRMNLSLTAVWTFGPKILGK